MADAKDPEREGKSRDNYQLRLVGLKPGDERPRIVVQALDKDRKVLHSDEVGKDGGFALPADVLKKSHEIAVGAPAEKGAGLAEGAARFRSADFAASVHEGVLALAEGIWTKFWFDWTCVGGRVELCRRRPWWFDQIFVAAALPLRDLAVTSGVAALAGTSRSLSSSSTLKASPALSDLIYWPYRCYTVCLGTVEVYRRTCCCNPVVFPDWRIDGLIRELEIIIQKLPKFPPHKVPPPPPPPVDPFRTPMFKGGALNEMALNAAHDLRALRTLPRDQAALYVSQRHYLVAWLCSCSTPVKVGSGGINPDGTFNICWRDFRRLLSPLCYDQYAYVVKQTIGGVTTTIYDGRAAGIWFSPTDEAVLTSYNPAAFTCGETGPAGGDAIVYLDLIGDTESHELITPDATGWDRVAAPADNSGLLFPSPGPFGHERNLGGGLELTYFFSLSMKTLGAKFYRVSVCRANSAGEPDPTATRYYYNAGLLWDKVVGLDVVPTLLGPTTVGGEAHLYEIPWTNDPWTGSVRYHALIDTLVSDLNKPFLLPDYSPDLNSASVRHLITIEVFDATGKRMRPLGTPPTGLPGAEITAAFKYHRWFQPGGSPGDDLKAVPFGALTHLFLWDNRPPVADITQLVMNTNPSSQDCQFLEGAPNDTFGIKYRAYTPDPRCLYDQDITWIRGLNGTAANGGQGSLSTPTTPVNVGQPPGPALDSGTNTFELMLTKHNPPALPTVLPRCSFAVTLKTWSKTTNGENFSYPERDETAAFALQIAATS